MEDLNFAKDKNISFNDFMTNINSLILEGDKEKIFLVVNEIYFSKTLSLEVLKVLSIRIFINLDSINEDFNVLNEYNRETLVDLISSICKLNDRNQLRCTVIYKLDELTRSKNNFRIYSPITYRAITYINENYSKDINIKEFCKVVNINPAYFGRKFNKEVGCSFTYYLNKKRNDVAKKLVMNTDKKIADISHEVGYLDISHFYKNFKKYFGISPARLREI